MPLFSEIKKVPLADFIESGITITAEVCCEILSKLRHEIQNRQHVMLMSRVVFTRNNAHSYTATCLELTSNSTKYRNWADRNFHHLPYSPDLASSDFHIFLYLKK